MRPDATFLPAGGPDAAFVRPTAPPATLDLADIQSLVLYPVAFLHARFLFLHVTDAAAGRRFVAEVAPLITNAVHPKDPGDRKPSEVTIAFTYHGLTALGLPERTLTTFPLEFVQGMAARARELLVDHGESDPVNWEPIWAAGKIDIWISVQASDVRDREHPGRLVFDGRAELDGLCQKILTSASQNGVEKVGIQNGGALVTDPSTGYPTDKEHFGYSDGMGNPDIAGSGWPVPPGSGKPDGKGGWLPIAAGEFLLGVPDEAGEMPLAPVPAGLAKNGTFLAYRKLHENVARFRAWLASEGKRFPGGPELLAAKVVGRFRDGTPLELSPDRPYEFSQADRVDHAKLEQLTNFTYADDPEGQRCPMGAHIRRVNPRDSLGFNGVLVDRRRIIRRGLPYGEWIPEAMPLEQVAELDKYDATHESRHGVIFMALGASIERQFEFIQREWMNYGNDFRQGNDRDPLLGNRTGESRVVIQGHVDGADARPPHICRGLPQFVTTRGGEYFFVPSLTAIRLIADGMVETS